MQMCNVLFCTFIHYALLLSPLCFITKTCLHCFIGYFSLFEFQQVIYNNYVLSISKLKSYLLQGGHDLHTNECDVRLTV